MRGLIETAIEREAERLDEILESTNHFDVPLFMPRHFGSRIRPATRRFSPRGNTRRRFSPHLAPSSPYAI